MRKHRFYVDVTYSGSIPPRKAARGLQLLFDTQLDLPNSAFYALPRIGKISVVEIRQNDRGMTR